MRLILTSFFLRRRKQSNRLGLVLSFSFIISLMAVLNVTAIVYSTSNAISVQVENVKLRDLFREIENNSDYAFFFNDQYAELDKEVSLAIKDEKIDDILNSLLDDTKLGYQILDNNFIVIVPKESMQDFTVAGTITDADGNSLPGVNVIEKGTTNGAITDLDGKYTLTVASADAILVFSFIGYLTEEIEVGNQTTINITLIESLEELGEVIVVGYGTMERTNVTGAISSIKTEELSKAPVPNFVEAMRGQVPGVRMTRTDGMPGSGVNFLVRGVNSLNSSNEPLIVIDGVPTTGGNIAELNPNDIESVNILKDAAAASIYGARGANGVILITTKTGEKGKPQVNFTLSRGYSDMVMKPELYDAEGFIQLRMDAAEGAGVASGIDDILTDAVEIENYNHPDGIQEIDWHDVLLRTGKITQIGLSLSGGTDKITFYLNGDAYQEDGIAQHTSYDRYSFRLNSEYTPYDFLKIGARVQLARTVSDLTGNEAVIYNSNPDFTDFLGNSPLGRLYNEQGELVPTVKGDQFDYNPLWKYRESETGRTTSRILLNPYIEINILKGLKYRVNASVEQRNEQYSRFTSGIYNISNVGDEPTRNYSEIALKQPMSYLLDNILSFDRVFADRHSINATLVYGIQTFKKDSLNVQGEGSITDLLSYNGINTSEQDYKSIGWDTDEWAQMYYAARIGYTFDRKYTITGTARYDGSSMFGPDTRWGGPFPSVSFAWNISEESFMENLAFFNMLKYRISWGEMGNDRIGTYGYIALTNNVEYPFNDVISSGYTDDKLGNAVLAWERSQQFNTGLDFALMDGRLFGTIDVYQTNTVDLLLDQQIPSVTGFTEIVSNIGEVKNSGIEAIVNYKALTGDFQWDISVNWARDKNEIVHLSGEVDEDGKEVDDLANGWFIGEDINEIYDFEYIGVWQIGEEAQAAAMHPDRANYGPGDPKIQDQDGNDTINFEDETFLGNPTPSWYGGIRNTFRYKGVELTVLIEAVQGVKRVNYFHGSLTGRGNEPVVDYWTPENPTNDFPQPHIQSPYYYRDAVRVRDASFVSIRNVSLSYYFPTKLISKIRISNLQIYIRGNNLYYFTDFVGYSPETNVGAFPITRNWTFGINLTF